MAIYYSIKDIKGVDEGLDYECEYSESLPLDSFDVEIIPSFADVLSDSFDDVSKEFDYPSVLDDGALNIFSYTLILYSKERSELDVWNEVLNSINKNHVFGDVEYLCEMIQAVNKTGLVDYSATVNKILQAVNNYKDHLNDGVDLSTSALFQLVRYIPFFSSKKNIDFYLEKDTGNIGVIIPMKKSKKGTLNLTIMSTSEVYYSYVRKKAGLVKFSGKGFLGDDLKNSDAIMSILKMSDW
ncbi:hypothetical protein M1I87_005330 [Serratia marcescens]|nr:hypothetical protein [Serratia marcescens]